MIYTVTSLAYDPDGAARSSTRPTTARTATSCALDPRDAARRELLQKDARIGDLVFNRADRSLWGIRHLNGIVHARADPAAVQASGRAFTRCPYGTVVYDLDVSPDGRALSASFGEIDGKQNVRVFSTEQLLAGDVDADGASSTSARRSRPASCSRRDGRYLVGSSYYTGVSNIFRYELATEEVDGADATPRPASSGRCRSGGRRPDRVPLHRRGLRADADRRASRSRTSARSRSSASGSSRSTRSLKSWIVGSPNDVDDRRRSSSSRARTSLAGGLRRESIYPVVQGYKDTAAVGVRANFSDPLQLNRLQSDRVLQPGDVARRPRSGCTCGPTTSATTGARGATWNDADFYDLFGPTKTSRKGYTVGARLSPDAASTTSRAASSSRPTPCSPATSIGCREYQNVAVDVDRLFAVRGDAQGQRHPRRRSAAWTTRKGVQWSVDARRRPRSAGQWFGRTHGDVRRRPAAAARRTRRSGCAAPPASSPGSRDEPFANFFFGGFGNNWVDHGDEKRYREYYAFPGAELNEIGGRNFVKSTLEWNLPPLRFRRVGTPGLLPDLDAAGGLRRRAGRPTWTTTAFRRGRDQRRRPARLPAHDAVARST